MPTMTVSQVMKQLEGCGAENVRAMYRRNGAGDNVYGVLLGKVRGLAKEIGTEHALAMGLWDTGNVDARTLACMAMDPSALTEAQARALLEPLTYVALLDELVGRVLVRAPCADALRDRWVASADGLQRRAGWKILTGQVARGAVEGVEAAAILGRVERESPGAPQRAREAMNHCLVEIALRVPALTEEAVAIGVRLGPWDLRPIPKGCTSSYPPEWIAVVLARKSPAWKPRVAQAVAVRVAAQTAAKKAAKATPAEKSPTKRAR